MKRNINLCLPRNKMAINKQILSIRYLGMRLYFVLCFSSTTAFYNTVQLAIMDTCVKGTLVQWGQLVPVSSTWYAVYHVYEHCLIRTLV